MREVILVTRSLEIKKNKDNLKFLMDCHKNFQKDGIEHYLIMDKKGEYSLVRTDTIPGIRTHEYEENELIVCGEELQKNISGS